MEGGEEGEGGRKGGRENVYPEPVCMANPFTNKKHIQTQIHVHIHLHTHICKHRYRYRYN